MNTNNSMDHVQEDQSSIDSSLDAESSQPQTIPSSDDTQTTVEALFYYQTNDLSAETQHVGPLVDSTETEEAAELSSETIPVLTHLVPSTNCCEIKQVSESLKRTLLRWFAEEREETVVKKPSKISIYLSAVPNDSAEFIYHGKKISVNIKQFGNSTVLGRGAFGTVRSAVVKGPPDISMAVKRIRFRTDDEGALLTYNELITMEKIGSGFTPYIIDYYCAMVDRVTSELCICMELMDTSVAEFSRFMHTLDDVPPNNLDFFVRRCAHNIASGLYFLETKDIVHRDVKPANILINRHGVIKLCDFGICGNLTDTTLDFIVFVGSAIYLPPKPERCAVQGDMWALGISLIEIFNGIQPFASYIEYQVPFVILAWDPIAPTTICDDMQELILHLLKKEARERPRSYADILNKPVMRKVTEIPSNDERDFVCCIIEMVVSSGSSN